MSEPRIQGRRRGIGRKLAYALSLLVAAAALGVALERQPLRRLYFAHQMFSGADQVENFRSMRTMFPAREITRAAHPMPLPAGAPIALPGQFAYGGKLEDMEQFLSSTDTTGLLVLLDGKIVYERYWRGNDATTHWISWSLAKSFVSALVGIAVHEGAIASIELPVTHYLPELRASAYDGVRIKDVLQMSSGASWSEDYSDWDSDVNRFGRTFALGSSLSAFVTSLRREHAPGTFNRYNSLDTQVLGMLLRKTTGRSLADYLHDKIWTPLAMESDAWWITDDYGAELAAGGLNATLRDYARLGLLYLNQGNWNGQAVVPADWVRASVTPDAPRLYPGKRANSTETWGYGYQWWVPDDSGDYAAVGIYNQFVYVSPAARLVIAKTSANHRYGTTNTEASYREDEHIAFFHAVVASMASAARECHASSVSP